MDIGTNNTFLVDIKKSSSATIFWYIVILVVCVFMAKFFNVTLSIILFLILGIVIIYVINFNKNISQRRISLHETDTIINNFTNDNAIPDATHHGTHHGTPNGISNGISNGIHHGIPNGIHHVMNNNKPQPSNFYEDSQFEYF